MEMFHLREKKNWDCQKVVEWQGWLAMPVVGRADLEKARSFAHENVAPITVFVDEYWDLKRVKSIHRHLVTLKGLAKSHFDRIEHWVKSVTMGPKREDPK